MQIFSSQFDTWRFCLETILPSQLTTKNNMQSRQPIRIQPLLLRNTVAKTKSFLQYVFLTSEQPQCGLVVRGCAAQLPSLWRSHQICIEHRDLDKFHQIYDNLIQKIWQQLTGDGRTRLTPLHCSSQVLENYQCSSGSLQWSLHSPRDNEDHIESRSERKYMYNSHPAYVIETYNLHWWEAGSF